MEKTELFELTSRLRRAMPRHAYVLALCEFAESFAVQEPHSPKRDRAAYMRDWRAKQKTGEN